MKKTLSEVVEIVGMSRRVIQEYEEAGLSPKPDTRNKYNHLLYDEKTIQGLCKIRFYRDLGYNKEQIKAILAENDNRNAVTSQIDELIKKKEKIEAAIAVAKVSDKMGLTPLNVRSSLPFAKAMSYDMLFSMLGSICGASADTEHESFTEVLTEEDYEALTEYIEKISESFSRGLPCGDKTVQDNVKGLHRIASKALSESMIFFSIFNLCLAPETELSEEFDELFGKGFSEYLFSAVRNYCIACADNPADRVINDAMKSIEYLGRKNYAPGSEEVRNEVRKLYEFYENIAAITPDTRLKLLNDLADAFESKGFGEKFNDDEKKFAQFISEAIRIFCNNFKNE